MSQHKHVRVLKAKRRERILPTLVKLAELDKATSKDLGVSTVDLIGIEQEGLIKRVDTVKTGGRGRPATIYRLTDSGRKRVKRATA